MIKQTKTIANGVLRKKSTRISGNFDYFVDTNSIKNYHEAIEGIRKDAGSIGILRRIGEMNIIIEGNKERDLFESYRNLYVRLNRNHRALKEYKEIEKEELLSPQCRNRSPLDFLDKFFHKLGRRICLEEYPLGLRLRETNMMRYGFRSPVFWETITL